MPHSEAPPAAANGASLDIDDVAGETDQDRGEGRAPFREDRLPDGGGGGATRVAPGHSGKDWAAECGNRAVRMKKKLPDSHENNGNHGRGVFRWHGKACGKAQMSTNCSLCQRKTEGGREKGLANLWRRKKIRKTPHVDRGQTIKWEIPIQTSEVAERFEVTT